MNPIWRQGFSLLIAGLKWLNCGWTGCIKRCRKTKGRLMTPWKCLKCYFVHFIYCFHIKTIVLFFVIVFSWLITTTPFFTMLLRKWRTMLHTSLKCLLELMPTECATIRPTGQNFRYDISVLYNVILAANCFMPIGLMLVYVNFLPFKGDLYYLAVQIIFIFHWRH